MGQLLLEKLNDLVIDKASVSVYLRNGYPLKGVIVDYDDKSIFLSSEKGEAIIMRNSIMSVSRDKHDNAS